MAESRNPPGDQPSEPRNGERIAKLLARSGVASRREVERMIADGRVKLNGEVLTTPATVLSDLAGVTVDGQPVAAPQRTRLFAFHKPAGLITAERDPAGRPTIYTALRNALPANAPRLMPVGRLDFSTEGLLLLTNDGEFKRLLELPATGIPRTYRARTQGTIRQEQLEALIEGITIDGVRYGRIDANLERRTGTNQWIELTIREGKNREVRRVLEHFGLMVSRLLRIGYGPFALDDLGRGQAVEIRREAVERFRKSLNFSSRADAMVRPEPAAAAPAPRAPTAPRKTPRKPAARKFSAPETLLDAREAKAGKPPAPTSAKRPARRTGPNAPAPAPVPPRGGRRDRPRKGPGNGGKPG